MTAEFDSYSDENLEAVARWEQSMRPGCTIEGCDCGNPNHVDPPRAPFAPRFDTRFEESARMARAAERRERSVRVRLGRLVRRFS